MRNTKPKEVENSYEGIRVLIAEDEPMAAKLARGALKLMGITDVVVAEDGLEAVKKLKEYDGEFELIISDWNMPKLNGIEFLRAVRDLYPQMPFIMLTAKANKEFVLAAGKQGVNGYIVKPFSLDQVHQKVESILAL
ncbi:MAG: hypothetical protein CMM47_06355 [Rhodospirillaceae bacterium]|nr:hypothetical protein [Rhodospirillaceae bacterium]